MTFRRLVLLSRRALAAHPGLFAFGTALCLGAGFGLLVGIAGASDVRARESVRAIDRADTLAKEVDRGIVSRKKALGLLAQMPSVIARKGQESEAFAAFRAAYPEFDRVGVLKTQTSAKRSTARTGLRTIRLFGDGPGFRLYGTMNYAWPTLVLDGRDRFGTDENEITASLVSPSGGRVRNVPRPLDSARSVGLEEKSSALLRWSDKKIYLTTFQPLSGTMGTRLGLRVATGIPLATIVREEGERRRVGLLLGLTLGLLSGTVAAIGISRSTRRLRATNDVLERRVAERTAELAAAERSFRGIFENVPLGLYQCEPGGRFLRVNPTLARTLGYASPEAAISGLGSLQAIGDPEARSQFLQCLNAEGEVREATTAVTRADGRVVWLAERARAVRDERGKIVLVEGAIHDVTAERELENQLRRLGETDPLTGLLNRRGLEEAIAAAEAPVSFVALDVDRFKEYNDSYGHPAGDRALQAVAETLKRTVRGSDAVARAGGEEFVVLLPKTGEAGARRVAEALREAVEACDILDTRLTVSGGVATADEIDEVKDAFTAADRALYHAKEEGRNRIVVNAAKLA